MINVFQHLADSSVDSVILGLTLIKVRITNELEPFKAVSQTCYLTLYKRCLPWQMINRDITPRRSSDVYVNF